MSHTDPPDQFRAILYSIADVFREQHRHDLGTKYQAMVGTDYRALKVLFLPTGEFTDDVHSVQIPESQRVGFCALMDVYADKFCRLADALDSKPYHDKRRDGRSRDGSER